MPVWKINWPAAMGGPIYREEAPDKEAMEFFKKNSIAVSVFHEYGEVALLSKLWIDASKELPEGSFPRLVASKGRFGYSLHLACYFNEQRVGKFGAITQVGWYKERPTDGMLGYDVAYWAPDSFFDYISDGKK